MTVDEIFMEMQKHSIGGIMLHSQLIDYFNFLSLNGYAEIHVENFKAENSRNLDISRYYIRNYHKLIPLFAVENTNLIPNSWFNYNTEIVDTNTRKAGIKSAFEKWVAWEKKTNDVMTKAYNELVEIEELNAASYVLDIIRDVNEELAFAEQTLIRLNAINYDMVSIFEEQDHIAKKYRKKVLS